MSDLLEWLLKPINKKTCRIVGIALIVLPLIFFFGADYHHGLYEDAIIFTRDWFRQIFIFVIILSELMGMLLTWTGFVKRKNWKMMSSMTNSKGG